MLVGEPFGRLRVGSVLRLDELESYFLFDLGIKDFIDSSHAPLAQLLDYLVASGEPRARSQFLLGGLNGFRKRELGFMIQLGGALPAKGRVLGILMPARGAFHKRIPLSCC